jgi:hypothetical protein
MPTATKSRKASAGSSSAESRKASSTRKRASARKRAPAKSAPTPVAPSLGGASDTDARVGQFARVVSGEHAGRYGVVEAVASAEGDGTPKTVSFRTRDADNAVLVVNYADLVPADAGGR